MDMLNGYMRPKVYNAQFFGIRGQDMIRSNSVQLLGLGCEHVLLSHSDTPMIDD